MANDQGNKVQQSTHPGSLYSKLGVPGWLRPGTSMSHEQLKNRLSDNPLAQSLMMVFGNKDTNAQRMANMLGDEFDEDQIKALQQLGQNKDSFMKAKQLESQFPKQYRELMKHLTDNKYKIFNGLVRQKGGMPGDTDVDQNPVTRFVSHITDEGIPCLLYTSDAADE